ncbi:MAG: cupin-like domain-containing protein [Nevskiales bacterium]|nr:cupin-like domain-containing protein [Nevskiales bacterium]
MELQIDRIRMDELSAADFVRDYLEPERPLLIEGVDPDGWQRLTPEYLRSRCLDERNRRPGWFVSRLIDDDVIRIPPVVGNVLARTDIRLTPTPMRLFSQPRGHVTMPHYDGFSLSGFNLQTQGSKRWIITAPTTPLATVPFLPVAMVGRDFAYDPKRHDFCRFDMKPGDMLFLPRYWYHEVHALTEPNLSLNWVWTPHAPNLSHPTGRREAELMACARAFPRAGQRLFPVRVNGYGTELIGRYSQGIGHMRVLRRLLAELLRYPLLLLRLPTVLRRSHEYARNNFRRSA